MSFIFYSQGTVAVTGDPFLITWTTAVDAPCNCFGGSENPISLGGPPAGPILEALLAIKGQTVIDITNPIASEWFGGRPGVVQASMQGVTLGTRNDGIGGLLSWSGGIELLYVTSNMTTQPVPIPELGTGWTGLVILALLGVYFYQRLRPRPCPVFH